MSQFQSQHPNTTCFVLLQTLVRNAILGIVLGLGIAIPMLILATQNVIVGLLAAGTLVAVTICVLGVIPLAGWKVDVSGHCVILGMVAVFMLSYNP